MQTSRYLLINSMWSPTYCQRVLRFCQRTKYFLHYVSLLCMCQLTEITSLPFFCITMDFLFKNDSLSNYYTQKTVLIQCQCWVLISILLEYLSLPFLLARSTKLWEQSVKFCGCSIAGLFRFLLSFVLIPSSDLRGHLILILEGELVVPHHRSTFLLHYNNRFCYRRY